MRRTKKHLSLAAVVFAMAAAVVLMTATTAMAAQPLDNFQGHPPIHVIRHSSTSPVGLGPAIIKSVYNLTSAGNGSGTVAIIDAYDSPTIQSDLNTFSAYYGLPQCSGANS